MQTITSGLFANWIMRTTVRTIKLNALDEEEGFDPNFAYLKELLSHNRNIAVTEEFDELYLDDGGVIEELCSASIGTRQVEWYRATTRATIPAVATALAEKASHDFQCFAFLLSNQIISMRCANWFSFQSEFGELDGDDSRSRFGPGDSQRRRRIVRVRRTQSSLVAELYSNQ